MLVRPLMRELSLLILLKAVALVLLFAAFFSPAHRPKVDADAMARTLTSDGAQKGSR